jgi:hypothetical protein
MGGGVVQEEIGGPLVAVGYDGDVAANPQRIEIGGVDVRNLLEGLGGGIDDPDGRSVPAAVLAPADEDQQRAKPPPTGVNN